MPLDEAFSAAAHSKLSDKAMKGALVVGKAKDQDNEYYEEELARVTGEIEEMNSGLLPRYLRVKAGTTLVLPGQETVQVLDNTYLGDVANANKAKVNSVQTLMDLNLDRLIEVPAGTKLKLPAGHEPPTYDVKEKKSLGEVAQAALGQADKAQKIYEANKDLLQPKVTLPAGAQIKVPQLNWPALASFGVLVLLMIVVGLGWILRTDPMTGGESTPGVELDTDRSAAEA